VAAAGELAIQVWILPWPTGSVNEATAEVFKSWHSERGGNDPGEIRGAIEQIGALLEQHGDARFDPAARGVDTRPASNRLGYVRGDGDERDWLVLPITWRDTFCLGFDAKMVAKALIERGMLLPDEHGKSSQLVWIDGKPCRAYVLPVKAWRGT
jgi:putative DNA primase/helicase